MTDVARWMFSEDSFDVALKNQNIIDQLSDKHRKTLVLEMWQDSACQNCCSDDGCLSSFLLSFKALNTRGTTKEEKKDLVWTKYYVVGSSMFTDLQRNIICASRSPSSACLEAGSDIFLPSSNPVISSRWIAFTSPFPLAQAAERLHPASSAARRGFRGAKASEICGWSHAKNVSGA